MTLDELTAASGVSRSAIVLLEAGKSTGSLKTWCALAEALGVPFWELARHLEDPLMPREDREPNGP